MGFFGKIKQFLGIVGVKVELKTDDTFSKTGDTIKGVVVIKSKTEQKILSVEIELEEVWRVGKGEDQKTKTFDLGKTKFTDSFVIKPGETREFPFTLKYSMIKSENDRLMELPKVGKALGGLGKMMDGEKSNFWLKAMADVEGAAFDPNTVKELKTK